MISKRYFTSKQNHFKTKFSLNLEIENRKTKFS